MKKTKVICTIGPSTGDKNTIRKMIELGMDVVRINLAHADHNYAKRIIDIIQELNKELKTNVGILLDTKGSDLRLETYNKESIEVSEGDQIVLTCADKLEDDAKFLVRYSKLAEDLNKDDKILLGDGKIELKVVDSALKDVTCEVVNSGTIYDLMGLNIPGIDLGTEYLSKAFEKDVTFASSLNVDFIALSYIRSANDVLDVNDILIKLHDEHMQIIAKVENENAIEDIDNIIKVSDGVMVARGDMGVEIDLEKVPGVQKNIVKKCDKANKICIVATQMLSSMEDNPRPTRAEVSDVANAVVDGVDAVMLSGETAIGKYPIETLDMMVRIIKDIESNIDYEKILNNYKEDTEDIINVIAYSTVDMANRLEAKAIVTSTLTGYTAKKISRFRPSCPVVVTTPNELTARELSLNWGVIPVIVEMFNSTDEIIDNAVKVVRDVVEMNSGKIIITGGFPITDKNTNFIKVEEILD